MTTYTYISGTNPVRIHATLQTVNSSNVLVARDVSAATAMDIAVRDPFGTVTILTAAFDAEDGTGDGTDGKIYADYTVTLARGKFVWDAKVVISSGVTYSSAGSFEVDENVR